MKIIAPPGRVTIETTYIYYSSIRNMYKNSNGSGFQADPPYNQERIRQLCEEIALKIYELQDAIKRS